MFLTLKTDRGKRYLYLMESIHVKGKRNCEKRIVKNYGRWEEVPEEIRRQYEDAQARKALTKQLESQARAEEFQKAQQMLSTPQSSPVAGEANPLNKGIALNYGHLPYRSIWEQTLGMKYKIGYLQKSKTDITTWQLNDLLYYLCSTKTYMPSSYYCASERRGDFFFCPWNGVTQDNFYRALDFVYEHRETLISHAVKSRMKESKTQVKVAFFDCTNTWFETPYDDLTWQIIRFTRKVRLELTRAGQTEDEINAYLEGDEFAEELAEELELQKDDILRMRGCSKEGRFAQPIVTVALAIDQTGFPIDCKVFVGNMSELKSIDPMLQSLKDKYAVQDVYFVADRGLNSTESLDKIKKEKLGFVVAQKVSMQKKEIREQMMDLKGYKNCMIGDDGEFLLEENETVNPKAYRFKVCDYTKESFVEDPIAGLTPGGNVRRKKLKVSCKIIYTFSPERRARDLADLDDKIAKANKAVRENRLMGNPCSTGWRALIQTQKEAAKSDKEKEQFRAVGLKSDVIQERRDIAGYAAVVYSHPDFEGGQKTSDLQVLSTYHKLVEIEDSFRTMKSTFSIRPVRVRLKERITAHCYLCVLSLMMFRALQEKLLAQGTPLSAARISSALRQALLMPMPAPDGKVQQVLNLCLHPGFHTAELVGKGRYEGSANDVVDHESVYDAFKENRSKTPDDLDLILKAVGLTSPSFTTSMGDLKKRLGVPTYSDDVLISAEHRRYLADLAGTT